MSHPKPKLCTPFAKTGIQLLALVITLVAMVAMFNLPATATTYGDTAAAALSVRDPKESTLPEEEQVVSSSITHRQYVTVICDGVPSSILADADYTVADVLELNNIKLNDYGYISLDPDQPLNGKATTIEIKRATVSYTSETVTLPYSTVYLPDTTMDRGTETLTATGVDGSSTTTYRVIELPGQEPRKEVIQTTTVDPVNETYTYGTKVEFEKPAGYSTTSTYITNIDDIQGTFTTSEGETYSFSKTLTLDATAYTAKAGAICSTGRLARVGVVAVDPDYIPYGTEMFIMSADGSFVYGLAVAGDCGGEIDDWDVDLYMTSHDRCINFGRQDVVAYVINSESV